MTTLDDLDLMDAATTPTGVGSSRKCRRHRWEWTTWMDDSRVVTMMEWCAYCRKRKDPIASRRGRTNRSRGNAVEREIGHRLGLRRVGQYGGPDDLSGEMFAAQVKSGGAFPERLWGWLRAVPVTAGQTALLVVANAPGSGVKRRAVVVLSVEDWIALHGPTEKEDPR